MKKLTYFNAASICRTPLLLLRYGTRPVAKHTGLLVTITTGGPSAAARNTACGLPTIHYVLILIKACGKMQKIFLTMC